MIDLLIVLFLGAVVCSSRPSVRRSKETKKSRIPLDNTRDACIIGIVDRESTTRASGIRGYGRRTAMTTAIDKIENDTLYRCSDEGASLRIRAKSVNDAAHMFFRKGDWEHKDRTYWVSVRVEDVLTGDVEVHRFGVHPDEPECPEGDHDWQSPHELVGGLDENPGVHGHGGGVVVLDVCSRCGAYRERDTWAQDRETGEQGLESVSYQPADEASLAWVESQSDDE